MWDKELWSLLPLIMIIFCFLMMRSGFRMCCHVTRDKGAAVQDQKKRYPVDVMPERDRQDRTWREDERCKQKQVTLSSERDIKP